MQALFQQFVAVATDLGVICIQNVAVATNPQGSSLRIMQLIALAGLTKR
jgi:hypothetical protein